MDRFTNKRSLENILVLASLGFGLAHAWIGRYSMNPDGVLTWIMGDALVRHDWAHAVNAYWSPLYGWMLGLVVGEIGLLRGGVSLRACCELRDLCGGVVLRSGSSCMKSFGFCQERAALDDDGPEKPRGSAGVGTAAPGLLDIFVGFAGIGDPVRCLSRPGGVGFCMHDRGNAAASAPRSDVTGTSSAWVCCSALDIGSRPYYFHSVW